MLGPLLALLSTAGYGLANIYIRRGLKHDQDTDEALIVTMSVYVVVLSAITGFLGLRGDLPPLNARGILYFLVAGVFTTFLGRIFSFAALRYLGPGRTTPYKATSPIFTTLLATLFLGETVSTGLVLGGIIVFVSLLLISYEIGMREGHSQAAATSELFPTPAASTRPRFWRSPATYGRFLALLSGASFGTGYFFRALGLESLPSVWVGAWVASVFAWVSQFGVAAVNGRARALIAKLSRRLRWEYVIAGALSTLGITAQFAAISHAPVSTVSVIMASEPIMVIVLTALFFSREESLTPRLVAGSLLVCLGLFIVIMA